MKSLKAIVDEVKIDLKQFTDDNRINYLEEYIEAKADDLRATLIRQDIDNRKGYAAMEFYTPTCCLDVTCVKQGCIIDGVNIPSGVTLWQVALPPLIEDVREYNIKYLGQDSFDKPFKLLSLSGFQNVIGDIWNKKTTYACMIGNIAYLKNMPSMGLNKVCCIGLWQSPTQLCDYNYATTMYPVPSDYQLKVLLKRDILSSWGYIYEDKQNNLKDDGIIPPNAAKSNSQMPTEERSNDE